MAATHGHHWKTWCVRSDTRSGALVFDRRCLAHLGAMPMVMITGRKAIAAAVGRFQVVDVIAAMKLDQAVAASRQRRQHSHFGSMPSGSRWKRPGPVHGATEDIAGKR